MGKPYGVYMDRGTTYIERCASLLFLCLCDEKSSKFNDTRCQGGEWMKVVKGEGRVVQGHGQGRTVGGLSKPRQAFEPFWMVVENRDRENTENLYGEQYYIHLFICLVHFEDDDNRAKEMMMWN